MCENTLQSAPLSANKVLVSFPSTHLCWTVFCSFISVTIPICPEQVPSYTWTVLHSHYVTYRIVTLIVLILEIKYNLPDSGIHQ